MPSGNLKPKNIVTNKNTANNTQKSVVGFCFFERTKTISIMPIVSNPKRNFKPYCIASNEECAMNNANPVIKTRM